MNVKNKNCLVSHSRSGTVRKQHTIFFPHIPELYTSQDHRMVHTFFKTACYSWWADSHHILHWLKKDFIFITFVVYSTVVIPGLLSLLMLLTLASPSPFFLHFPPIPQLLSIFTTPLLLSLHGTVSVQPLPCFTNLSTISLPSLSPPLHLDLYVSLVAYALKWCWGGWLNLRGESAIKRTSGERSVTHWKIPTAMTVLTGKGK